MSLTACLLHNEPASECSVARLSESGAVAKASLNRAIEWVVFGREAVLIYPWPG